MTAEQLDTLSKEAQASANAINWRLDGGVEAYRALLVVREACKTAAQQIRRIQPTSGVVKKLCPGCGDNHAPFMCP